MSSSLTSLTIALARHANTTKAAEGQHDNTRVLTDKGREQSAILKQKLARHDFDIVFASSSARTRETAEIAFGRTEIVLLDELYLPSIAADYEACDAQFSDLGYKPPVAYLTDPRYQGWLHRQSVLAAGKIMEAVIKRGASKIGIVGHAVCANGVAACLDFRFADDLLHTISLGEAGCCLIGDEGLTVLN